MGWTSGFPEIMETLSADVFQMKFSTDLEYKTDSITLLQPSLFTHNSGQCSVYHYPPSQWNSFCSEMGVFHVKMIMSQLMRYLSCRRPAKAQASLRICAVSPEPSLVAHMKYGSR